MILSSTLFHDVTRQSMEYTVTQMLLSFLQLHASNADGKDLSKLKFIHLEDSFIGQAETPIHDLILALLHWISIGTR